VEGGDRNDQIMDGMPPREIVCMDDATMKLLLHPPAPPTIPTTPTAWHDSVVDCTLAKLYIFTF